MSPRVKPFSEAQKRAAIELWKANISLKRIREQVQMSERGLRNILAYAKKHPGDLPSKVSLGSVRKIRRALDRNPSITGKTLLKKNIPDLANVSVRTITRVCCETLKLPSRKMVDKPLLPDRMKNDRLEFDRWYAHWGVEE
jgi:hypothetical protein